MANWSFREGKSNSKWILLLHGYGQTGEVALQLFNKYLPEEWSVAALDGPLEGHQGGRAWYLFDRAKGVYLTPLAEAYDFIVDRFQTLQLPAAQIIVLGYSQGGYLAPFVGMKLKATCKVIGLNSRFRSEDLQGAHLKFPLVGIHGENDQIVDMGRSRLCHQEIVSSGVEGEFVVVPRSGHKFDRALGKALRFQTF